MIEDMSTEQVHHLSRTESTKSKEGSGGGGREQERKDFLSLIANESVQVSRRATSKDGNELSSGEKMLFGIGNTLDRPRTKKGDLAPDTIKLEPPFSTVTVNGEMYDPGIPLKSLKGIPSGQVAITGLNYREGDRYIYSGVDSSGQSMLLSLKREDVVELALLKAKDDLQSMISSTANPNETTSPFPKESLFATGEGQTMLKDAARNIQAFASDVNNPLDIIAPPQNKDSNGNLVTDGSNMTTFPKAAEMVKKFAGIKSFVPPDLVTVRAALAAAAAEKKKIAESPLGKIASEKKSAMEAAQKLIPAVKSESESDEDFSNRKTKTELALKNAEAEALAAQNALNEYTTQQQTALDAATSEVTKLEAQYKDLLTNPPSAETLNAYYRQRLGAELPNQMNALKSRRDALTKENDDPSTTDDLREANIRQIEEINADMTLLRRLEANTDSMSGFFDDLQRGERTSEMSDLVTAALSGGKLDDLTSAKLVEQMLPNFLSKDATEDEKKEMSKAMSILLKTGGILLVGIICMLVDAGTEGKSNFATVIASLMNSGRFGDLSYNDQEVLKKMRQARELGKSVKVDSDGKAQIIN